MREEGDEGGRARCAAFSPFAAAGVVAHRVERLLGQRPAVVVVVVVAEIDVGAGGCCCLSQED